MKKFHPVAVLQIIPNHHQLLPVKLIKALAMLDEAGCSYGFYDIERSLERDFRLALLKLFSSIKEDIIIVSMACHNNYPKIESLIFLYLYLPLLRNKKVIICSHYFSLYDTTLIQRENVIFSPLDIDEYVTDHMEVPSLSEKLFLERLVVYLARYGYQNYNFGGYLTFGCKAKCSFCFNRLPFKGAPDITKHSVDSLLNWMRAAHYCGKKYFDFSEPSFLADKPLMISFFDRLKSENLGVTWRCKARLDDIDSDIYDRMTAAGCRKIFFGFEHVDQRLLKQIHKGENTKKAWENFLKYRLTQTRVDLSFLIGIFGETAAMLRRNLEMAVQSGTESGVQPIVIWQILYNRRSRVKTVPNYIIPFMFMLNFIPGRMEVSTALIGDMIRMCIREPFFDFFCMTESQNSLALMQELVIFLKTRPQQEVIRDYDRLLGYQGGELTKLILKNQTLEDLNNSILSMVGV